MSDFNVVFSYTADDAVNDGVLVEPWPSKFPKGLFTAALWAKLLEVAADRDAPVETVAVPLFMDAVMVVRAGREKDPNEYLWTKGLEGNATGETVWVSLNDAGGVTLMFPSDY